MFVCTYLRIVPVVCLCVCLFVNFSALFLLFHLLKYCIVFNHCVRNMFVCKHVIELLLLSCVYISINV